MNKIIVVIGLCIFVGGCGKETSPTSKVRSVMSPCQCAVSGGCGVEWSIGEDEFYSDRTSPNDYNKWGKYVGEMEVPSICR